MQERALGSLDYKEARRTWNALKAHYRIKVEAAQKRFRLAHADLLDARMEHGYYEKDLAEPQEQVFV